MCLEVRARLLPSCDVIQSMETPVRREPRPPGTIYLAREDYPLAVTRDGTALLTKAAMIEGFRPSATFLFRSVAEAYGDRTLALILTGMGRDGVEGLRSVRKAGGTIFAQDEASCVVFGMPGAAVAEELADQVLPIDRMAKEILARVTGITST